MTTTTLTTFGRAKPHGYMQLKHGLRGLTSPLGLPESNLPKLVRGTITTLSISVALFIIWAAVTPVREVAKTEGQIVPSGYNQIVQHLDGGLIREILVHEGDLVQKDQILVRVDGVGTEQDVREQQALLVRVQLQAERVRAFIDGRKPDFSKLTGDTALIEEQQRTYDAAEASRISEQGVLREQLGQRERALGRLQVSLATARSNQQLAKEALDIYTQLIDKGLTNRTNYLSRREQYNSRRGEVAELTQEVAAASGEVSEYRQRLDALETQLRSSSYEQLHALESEIAQRQEELSKGNQRADRLDIRSPVMGYVKGLRVNTVGAVIPAAQTIMEIVPVDERLVVEIHIPPEEIGRIAVGQEAQIKVDSFDYIRFGMARGKLESVSATTFTDEVSHRNYYKGRVILDHDYIGDTPGRNVLIPGMTVNADIVTGEKTIMGYLLRPIRTAMQNALTEQ